MKNNKRQRLYHVFMGMKSRCYNKNHQAYENYGGRGITICDEWLNDFQAFYKWAIKTGYTTPKEKGQRNYISLDRIDTNGNYEPSNCRWVNAYEQIHNRRSFVHPKSNLSHGLSKNPLYGVWVGMRNRCYNPKMKGYLSCGALGIKIAEEWRNDLPCFMEWAYNNGYKDGLYFMRIDKTKDFAPDNCEFISQAEFFKRRGKTK